MDSLSKKIQNLGIHDFRNAGRFMQNMIVQYEPYQIDIRRATNTDAWGPTTKHLQKVMRNRYSVPLYLMTEYILKRVVDHIAKRPKNLYEKARKEYVNYGAEWRVILKCLTVIEYLLLNVDEMDELNQVKSCLESHKQILANNIMSFKIEFSNDGKMEIHERSIQKKCTDVLKLVEDPEFLSSERQRTKKNAMKIQRAGSISNTLESSASSYNANAIDDIEFDMDDHTSNISNTSPQQARRMSNIEEQRKQRREILRERIKQSEQLRKQHEANKSTSSAPVVDTIPDLLDMDFDEPAKPVAATKEPEQKQNQETKFNNVWDDENDNDNDDEFGDFQSETLSGAPTTAAPTATLSTAPTEASEPKKDAFADLFQNSKSLI